MPQLQHDLATRGVNSIGHLAPAGDLFWRINPRGIEVALGHRADLAGFGDDQAGAGPLAVILDGHRTRPVALDGPITGQRGHDDAVGQGDVADFDGVKQRTHDDFPW